MGPTMQVGNMQSHRSQTGFTYVAMLYALAIFGVGLAAIGESWSAASYREKEEQLIQVGNAYVRAIGMYYAHSPGSHKTYPLRLEELTEDKRFVGVERYLRQVYLDPVTNGGQWGLVRAPDGGIMGVYSLSDKPPLHQQPIVLADSVGVVGGARYSDWKFVYKAKQ